MNIQSGMMQVRFILILIVLLAGAPALFAASRAETRAFDAAVKAFKDSDWVRAEWEFADFVTNFPESERRAEAVLWQAQAAIKQSRFAEAIDLLSAHLGEAGAWADRYLFWLGEAHFAKGDFERAAAEYAKVIQDFPQSARRLDAVLGEAMAQFRLEKIERVVQLLQDSDGAFQRALRNNPNLEPVARGALLLAEAQVQRDDFRAAEETLARLGEQMLDPELSWRREYLRCRIDLAEGKPESALECSSNLIARAVAIGRTDLQTESVVFQARLLENLGRLEGAASVYEMNLAKEIAPDQRRAALLKIVDLLIAQNKTDAAIQRLQKFLADNPNDPVADMALLTLGEMQLKEHLGIAGAPTPPATNLLAQARTNLVRLVNDFPMSESLPRARLNLGWCYWLEGNVAESLTQFQAAAESLQSVEERAVARFKWADAQFAVKDFSGAVTNYGFVVEQARPVETLATRLVEPALYQIVRAGLGAGNVAAASNAVSRILEWYPDGFYTDRSLLLLGQAVSRGGSPENARRIFSEFLNRAGDTALAPQIRLAIARTYEQEANWSGAAEQYGAWIAAHPEHPARPRAEYDLAWAFHRAGLATNALAGFTNFVARHPTNALAPLAQFWVGDFHFRNENFPEAEKSYQELYQKWPGSELAAQARMMAGRSAFARGSWSDARKYFTELVAARTSANLPPEILAEANFALADAIFSQYLATVGQFPDDAERSVELFREARDAFNYVAQNFPTNRLAALAQGRLGDCFLQRAAVAKDPAFYDSATNAYQKVVESPHANVAARSQAAVGLGETFEKIAAGKPEAERAEWLRRALDQHLNVVYETNLRDDEARGDPFWMQKAGLEAARLIESLGAWEQAEKLYARLAELLPPLRPMFEEKIARAKASSRVTGS